MAGAVGAPRRGSLLLKEEGWVWETPSILSMEDILVPTSSCHGFQALGVPPPPKDQNAAHRKHRDEILRQIRELVKSEACVSSDFGLLEADMGFQSQQKIQLRDMISNVEKDVVPVVVPCSQEMTFPRQSRNLYSLSLVKRSLIFHMQRRLIETCLLWIEDNIECCSTNKSPL